MNAQGRSEGLSFRSMERVDIQTVGSDQDQIAGLDHDQIAGWDQDQNKEFEQDQNKELDQDRVPGFDQDQTTGSSWGRTGGQSAPSDLVQTEGSNQNGTVDSDQDQTAGAQSDQTVWSDRLTATALFVGVFCVYIAVLHGRIEIYDTQSMMGVTEHLVNQGSLVSNGGSWILDTKYAPYGIADSLLAVPAYAFSKVIGGFAGMANMVNPILTAFSVVLVFRIARALGWRAFHGFVAAVGFGLASMAVWYSTELLSEPGVTLCVLAIMLGIIRWGQGRPWAPLWIGLAAAAAIQFRSDSVFTVWVAFLAVPLFVSWSAIWSRRSLLLVLAPMAVSLGFLGWYNDLRFNKILIGTYGPSGGFVTPLWHGLDGLLLSPGKSLFVFDPLTVMGVIGLVVLFVGRAGVRNRPFGVLCLLLVVPRILFFSKWGVWDAGVVWGPRFLLPVVPVLTLALIPVLQATDPRRIIGVVVRAVTVVLALAGVLVNALSVRVPYGEWWGAVANPHWRLLFHIHGGLTPAERSEQIDFHLVWSPIWGEILLLRHHMALVNGEWWTTGHGAVGVVLLVAGAVYLVAAAIGSSRPPRRWAGRRQRDELAVDEPIPVVSPAVTVSASAPAAPAAPTAPAASTVPAV